MKLSSDTLRSVFEVLDGQLFLVVRIPVEPDIKKFLRANGMKMSRDYRFTPREHQVALGIVRGLSNKEIASEIHLSERTVKFHVSKILGKTGCLTRIQVSRSLSEQALRGTPPRDLRPKHLVS